MRSGKRGIRGHRRALREADAGAVAHIDLGANAQRTVRHDVQERLRNGEAHELTRIDQHVEHGAVRRSVNGALVEPGAACVELRRRGIAQGLRVPDILLARTGAEQRKFRARFLELRRRDPRVALDLEQARGGDGHALLHRVGAAERLGRLVGARLRVANHRLADGDLVGARAVAVAVEGRLRRGQLRFARAHVGLRRPAIERDQRLRGVHAVALVDQYLVDDAADRDADRHRRPGRLDPSRRIRIRGLARQRRHRDQRRHQNRGAQHRDFGFGSDLGRLHRAQVNTPQGRFPIRTRSSAPATDRLAFRSRGPTMCRGAWRCRRWPASPPRSRAGR